MPATHMQGIFACCIKGSQAPVNAEVLLDVLVDVVIDVCVLLVLEVVGRLTWLESLQCQRPSISSTILHGSFSCIPGKSVRKSRGKKLGTASPDCGSWMSLIARSLRKRHQHVCF